MDRSSPVPAISPTLIDLHQNLTDICLIMRRKLRDHFDHKKTSFNQYRILRVLKKNPDYSLSSLDEQLAMKKGNLSRLVDGMVRQGLITRERDTSSDRRKIALSLTLGGEKILDELDQIQGELIKTLYRSVPEVEIEQFHDIIARLLHYFRGSAP
nr:MarR family transcriptional regulator [Candidatus Sigynarchaeota archaeon]